MKKGILLTLVLVMALLVLGRPAPSALAQSSTPTMAGIQGGVLVFFYSDSDPVIVDEQGAFYRNLKWSSDGQYLAYIRGDANYNWQLVFTNIAGDDPQVLVEGYAPAVPDFSWTDDNRLLYAAFDPTFQPTGPDGMINVYRRIPHPAEADELLATVPFGSGCGGGSSFPGDVIYWTELAEFGKHSTLELTPSGIVYSRGCTNTSLALYDLNTATLTELGLIANASLSPDRTQVAGAVIDEMGTYLSHVVVIDLATQARNEIATPVEPDNVIWTADTTIFYSAHSQVGEVPLPEDIANNMGGAPSIPLFLSEVYFLNPVAGTTSPYLSQPGYRIGRLAATGNPNTILASVVPNGDVWVSVLMQGGTEDPLSLFLPTVYYVTGTDGGGASSTSNEIIQHVTPHPSLNAE